MVKKINSAGKVSKTALLAGAALALPVAAKADIVFVDSGNVPFTLTSPSSGTPTADSESISMMMDGTNDFNFTANGSTGLGEDSVATVSPGAGWAALPTSTSEAAPLAFGTLIGPGSSYPFETGTGILQKVFGDPTLNAQKGPWPTDGSSAYLGVEFEDASTMLHYGWIQVSACVPDDSGTSNPCNDPAATLTVISYAYQNTANTPILAGQTTTPEPSSCALFALGAAGLAIYRRRKQAA